MKKIGLDKFRVIVAILIIAIHIYPLSSINETADFVFTHCICRIGVPFFLMITGYFILPKAMEKKKNLVQYTIKILKIYLISIILYLPINIYANQLNNITFFDLLKKILINGTLYHLWYFPALILGIWITYFILKNLKRNNALFLIAFLYVIGLFGDSYYGISTKFEITSNLQKHDSMYFMLIPVMICLFNLILQNYKENNQKLRTIATTIYIIHPMFIIIIRGVAKILHLQNIIIDNSVINYILVVICSIGFSVVLEIMKEELRGVKNGKRFKKKQSMD